MSGSVNLCVGVACNDEFVLKSCLLASPDIGSGVEVFVEYDAASAAKAYNAILEKASCDVVILVHQDVFLPPGWLARFKESLAWLDENDPRWGVLGVWGADHDGQFKGWVYSAGLKQLLGGPFKLPRTVRVLDEVLLAIGKHSGLRFDESLEGFHLYGTDLCLEAESKGLRNYVIPAFLVHNSAPMSWLPLQFWRSYSFVRGKWKDRLPVITPCITLKRFPARAASQVIRSFYKRLASGQGRKGRSMPYAPELYKDLLRKGIAPASKT